MNCSKCNIYNSEVITFDIFLWWSTDLISKNTKWSDTEYDYIFSINTTFPGSKKLSAKIKTISGQQQKFRPQLND